MTVHDRPAREDFSGDAPSFIGRRREVSAVRRMLAESRLVTLTGPGGVGKTRLALRVADASRTAFRGGVAVVELAKLEDPDLLGLTVAASLGLQDAGPERDPVTMLVDYLAGRRVLLVLDNCEHVLDVCAELVTQLLRHAPRLRILATSRQSLGVYGERVFPVPSLSVPDSGECPREIAKHEAVRLFVDRAVRACGDFVLDDANASAVARLSQRLDGIPLAIELAAVRLRTHPLERLIRQLDERFEVLVGGSTSALPRHQTLRATMDWSYQLCSPAERRLWSRLSIFTGGVELETVEKVCSGGGIAPEEVFDLVAGLVDKSVLVGERAEDTVRYRMLETIRAYGRDRLDRAEYDELRHRYVHHYHDLAKRNRIDMLVPDQMERFRWLQRELPNMRVALELCLDDQRTAPLGLATASALWCYWLLSGALAEGRYWLERGLDLVPEKSIDRGTALWVDSMLALRQGDPEAALPRLEECHAIAQELPDGACLACAIRTSGVAAFSTGDVSRGLAQLEEALARHREARDLDAMAFSLYYAASYGSVDAPERSAELGEEFLKLAEEHRALVSRAYAQFALASAVWNLGNVERAEQLMREAVRFRGEIGDRWGLTQCLELLAWTAGARGDHERAAWLLGAGNAMWEQVGASPTRLSYHARWHERCVAQARQALGGRGFTAAFREGARSRLNQVLAFAAGGGVTDAAPQYGSGRPDGVRRS